MHIFEVITLKRQSATEQVAADLGLKIKGGEIEAVAPVLENAIASSLKISNCSTD